MTINLTNQIQDVLGVKNKQALYEQWRKKGRRGVFREILSLVRKKNQISPLSTFNGGNDSAYDHNSYIILLNALKELLEFKDDGMKITKAALFLEAIEDWTEDKSHDVYTVVHALCLLNPKMAFTAAIKEKLEDDLIQRKVDNTKYAFQQAAKYGATELVAVMLQELLKSNVVKDKDAALDEYVDLRNKSDQKTAFMLTAENLQLEVLELLLMEYPRLANRHGTKATIGTIIRKMGPNQSESIKTEALKALELILPRMDMDDDNEIWGHIWQEAVKTPSTAAITYLLGESNGKLKASRFVTYPNAKFVIENGNLEMWRKFNSEQRRDLMVSEDLDLLHTAVANDKADIIEDILQEFPEQIEVQAGGKYALEELKHSAHSYQRIRDTLLHAMIRSTSENLGIREVRAIIGKSNVEADTICLHLSNMDTEEQSFGEYVQWLREQKEEMGRIFKFERVLKYAKFPDLHTQVPKRSQNIVAGLREPHSEIRGLFEWLERRGVKQVLGLSVPDRLLSPHADDDVEYCANTFQVRILKWRKLDIYLGNLNEEIKDGLKELHLYSSGNRAVHDHWYSELKTNFPELRKLFVYVVADVMSEKRLKESVAKLQQDLDKINRNDLNQRWTRGRPGLRKDHGRIAMVPVEEYHWGTDRGFKTYRNLDEIRNHVVGPNLAAFINKYVSYKVDDKKRTKVAVIDSGVIIVGGKSKHEVLEDVINSQNINASNDGQGPTMRNVQRAAAHKGEECTSRNDLVERVADGKSYVNTGDDEEQVWWHASEPHGTQMARLICSIDPCCKLYVVKVAETRNSGIAANVVAQAIDWAIEKKVDVISLSLVAFADASKMMEQIEKARNKDIVVLVSTADTGLATTTTETDKSKNNEDLFTIAACDRWGNLLPSSQKSGYRFRFVGHNVQVGQIPFLKSEEFITGSSAATAIAAGTASLILACCRISSRCYTEESGWRYRMVKTRFEAMGEGDDKPIHFESTVSSEFVSTGARNS
ncbi:hypothetical protein F4804DRAFT_313992 [Jackrogersella minutella]|nr:hypothetical protein F4804DRAFT_313992 [Jackrogersella minutella]